MVILSHGFGLVKDIVGAPPIPETILDTRRVAVLFLGDRYEPEPRNLMLLHRRKLKKPTVFIDLMLYCYLSLNFKKE